MINDINKNLQHFTQVKKDNANNWYSEDNNIDSIFYLNNKYNEKDNLFENKIEPNLYKNNVISLKIDDKKFEDINDKNINLEKELYANKNMLIQTFNSEENFIQNENFYIENNYKKLLNTKKLINNIDIIKEENIKNKIVKNNNIQIISQISNQQIIKEKEDKKTLKKKGRKKKDEISNSKRNKFAKDNINKKIKRIFLHSFLFKLFQSISLKNNYSQFAIKKFNKELVSETNISFNINLFKLSIRDLLKTKISQKYKIKKISPNENEKILNILEKIEDFKILLEMKLIELYKIFIKNKEEFHKIMEKLFKIDYNYNFEYYVNLEKDEKYKEMLLKYAKNYENVYLNLKYARKIRKNINYSDL